MSVEPEPKLQDPVCLASGSPALIKSLNQSAQF